MSDLKQLLLKELLAISGVTEKIWPDRDYGFSSLSYKNKDFAHFHNNNELDLRLTAKIIKAEGVLRPSNSTYHPDRSNNSPWIEVRFATPNDLPNVIRLVKLAIAQI
jgi:Family of unknown function (DUF5519)